jgi:hypothetical protein
VAMPRPSVAKRFKAEEPTEPLRMGRRRVLRGQDELEQLLHQIRGVREDVTITTTRREVFLLSLIMFFVVVMSIGAFMGNINAALVGMVALVFLVMSFMLVMANFLVTTGRFDQRTIIYWYMAAVGIGLLVAYAVSRGVLPLLLEGVAPAQFEFLLSWAIWFVPILLIVGILIIGLATPPKR